jgi:hypothetical protein
MENKVDYEITARFDEQTISGIIALEEGTQTQALLDGIERGFVIVGTPRGPVMINFKVASCVSIFTPFPEPELAPSADPIPPAPSPTEEP